jgi:hypothetical protein
MIQKKEPQNIHEKVIKGKMKKRKDTKKMLTSMTSHIKKDLDPEEEAEDHEAEELEQVDEEISKSIFKQNRRESILESEIEKKTS